ncbi:hypothetical protein BU054_12710 [Staphylococcus simulans]|nr:hypothetical protein BU054_12710 [Staphylococcus simulans]PTJ08573.1 hypothetical protein BU044_12670 [Staphylococcus simulans]PTJ37073.1 hypothetical protein BU021_12845 [Staphylococcus simulans]
MIKRTNSLNKSFQLIKSFLFERFIINSLILHFKGVFRANSVFLLVLLLKFQYKRLKRKYELITEKYAFLIYTSNIHHQKK